MDTKLKRASLIFGLTVLFILIIPDNLEKAYVTSSKVLEKEARRFGLNLKNLTESDEFATLVKDYGVSRPDDLFAAVGYGKISPRQVISRYLPEEKMEPKTWGKANIAQAVRRVLRSGRFRPLGQLPQPPQLDVRPRTANRGRVGTRR